MPQKNKLKPLMNIFAFFCKNLQENASKLNPAIYKEDYTP
jgi:hypothetical protein